METPIVAILKQAVKNQQNGTPFILATVVVGAEKTPGRSGFKLIAYENGKSEGTVGGGKLERMVLQKCEELFLKKENAFETYILTDTSEGIGMACGGEAKVFFEFYSAGKRIFIFGAGHLCRSILPLLKPLGFYTVVVDNREEYANPERLETADKIIATDYDEYLKTFSPKSEDAVLIFTHGHIYDYDILDKICKANHQMKYIGMIGSTFKVREAVEEIRKSNYDGKLIEAVHAPVGLNIGKTTTQEIAISICAEILAIYNNKSEIDFLKNLRGY